METTAETKITQRAVSSAFTKEDTLKLKGLAIILLIVHHCFMAPNRYEGQEVIFFPFSERKFNFIALSFKICVALFLFISAYGITISYKSKFPDYKFSAVESEKAIFKRLVKMLSGFLFIFILAQIYSVLIIRGGRYSFVYGSGLVGALYCLIDALGLAELFCTPTFLATFWYMSLATIAVILIPIMIKAYKRFGIISVLMISILVRMFFKPVPEAHYCYLPDYLFCIGTGIWSADIDVIGLIDRKRLFNSSVSNKIVKLLAILVIGAAAMYLRQKTKYTTLQAVWDGIIPILACYLVHAYIAKIPLIDNFLSYLGKHSMNIFLIHNFIRIMWYYDFTYSFKYWWLITIVLLAISVVLSNVVELLKRITKYDVIVAHILTRCDALYGESA